MTNRNRVLPGALPGALLIAACLVTGPAPAHAAPAPGVALDDAFFLRGSGGPLFGFFTIDNKGDAPLLITAWASPGCRSLQLEESGASAGQSGSDQLTIPPRTRMVFAPGGYHLLCTGPDPSAGPGARLAVTATLLSGRTLAGSFAIRPHS